MAKQKSTSKSLAICKLARYKHTVQVTSKGISLLLYDTAVFQLSVSRLELHSDKYQKEVAQSTTDMGIKQSFLLKGKN